MRPPKRVPLKKKDPTPISSVPDGLGEIFNRYMFNIGKIEQRVRSEPSNGIVINCATGEYEFDPELCNARSDEELVETVRRLERQPKFGRSVFSSVAPDPGQKNKALQAQWREFNKQFEEEYNNKNKENKSQKMPSTSWAKDRKMLSSIRGGCSSSSALASSSSASSSSNTAPTVCSTRSYKSPKKNATKRHKPNP